MSSTAVTYEDLVCLDGRVRTAFEHRTAWNGLLVHDADGSLLRWQDLKNGPKRDRDFELGADEDGCTVCVTKPEWGRMTVARERR